MKYSVPEVDYRNYKTYVNRVGGVLSRVANVIFLNGNPAESISGRSFRMFNERPASSGRRRLVKFIDALFFLQGKEHCRKAYEEDIEYAQYRLDRHKELFP